MGDHVEVLYQGEWYSGLVTAEDEVSSDGVLCMRVFFNRNDPTGRADRGWGHILIPIGEIAARIRNSALRAYHASLRDNKSAAFKNSVKIRF